MAWFVNPYAAVGYAGMLAAWGIALLVLLATPTTRQARILPFLLVIEGFGVAGGHGIMWSTADFDNAYAWQMIGIACGVLGCGVYLLFVATLPTPLAKPLRPRAVQWAIALAFGGLSLYVLLRPLESVTGMFAVWWAPFEPTPGPLWMRLFVIIGLTSFYALACTVDAWRRAPRGSEARRRASLYMVAFGVRDFFIGLLYFTGPLWFQQVQPWSDIFVIAILPGTVALFCVLVGYGVLRAQLFDIDLRLKRGISRGTLAGVFLVVFVVVAEAAQNYTSDTYGYLAGSAAAGLLLLALTPLQRIASRVSEIAVPPGRVTTEYLAFRKLDVYKAAVESAHETGGITTKERATLDRLREKLGLAEPDARAIEHDLVA